VIDWCEKCEEMMQPFLDGALSTSEVKEAERHLELCSWCAKRYRFEERLRHYVRVVAAMREHAGDRAWIEPGPVRQHDQRVGRVLAQAREAAAQRGAGALRPRVALHQPGLRPLDAERVRARHHDDLVDRRAFEGGQHRGQELRLLRAAVARRRARRQHHCRDANGP
jgi:hypothetical protein